MTKTELFLKLAAPNNLGQSRWVSVDEFKDEFSDLKLGNGGSWCRKESQLAKKYVIEFDKSITSGNGIDRIRLNGLVLQDDLSQQISSNIKKIIKNQRCVILGTSNPEVDHKNGMKNDPRVMNTQTQVLSDFQPLSKAANDAKRQICKNCMLTKTRFDAKLLGYPISYYSGSANHNFEINACVGCFWFDPIEFRKHLKKHK
jgi:hypothetical protein